MSLSATSSTTIAPSDFVNLHNHTHYSMLDGASRIPDVIARVKELGQTAVAITDHGNMHGAYELWRTAVDNDIKPIIGIEAYVTPGTSRYSKERVHWGTQAQVEDDVSGGGAIAHFTLWASTNHGLKNLIKASSRASLEGRFGKWGRMDDELLEEYHEGLIASSGCPSGIVQTRLRLGQFDKALETAAKYQDIFGKENFYIELMNHGLSIETRVIKDLVKISKKLNAPLVATNDSHYVTAKDRDAQDALLCINSGSKLEDPNRFKFEGEGYYLKSAQEMMELFKEFPQAVTNTVEIAERCNVIFDDNEDGAYMPEFPCPEGWDETSYFLRQVEEGLEKRYPGGIPQKIIEQADYECGVICQMQFPGYFLVVCDYIQWAKKHNIQVGPGRGSAGGAVVAYAMGITEIDPLEHGLIFERFLNPERISLPDIDTDFDPEGRAEVLQYVSDKYGADHVAQCTTYGTIKTKQALKDAARIMGYDFQMGENVTKALPPKVNGQDITLSDVFDPQSKRYKEAREFRELYESDPDARRIIDRARSIEGLIRQTGVHACATIMSSVPITDISPLMERTDGTITTAFEYHTCETLGLVKNDFLGLSNLTVIRDTIANVANNLQEKVEIEKISLDDKRTYELLATGETLGVFQLDSDGMRSLLSQLKPTQFSDISALIALYRPGPMDMGSHTKYARRKNNLEKVEPINAEVAQALAPVLDETYGLVVYQEQVQSAARILAGYSLGRADILRRAMGKKKPEVLVHEQKPFFEGMEERGYSRGAAQDVWDVFLPFAGYAFNKSHSACYAMISYWTAYLKAHYPVEFMAALLQNERANKDKTAIYLAEARRMDIQILQPDVNESIGPYAAVGSIVRFGLAAVRGIGERVVEQIIDTRQKDKGPFVSFLDFIQRVPLPVVNKRILEALIKSGSFDSIEPNRRALFMAFEPAIEQILPVRKHQEEGQFDLFALAGEEEEAPSLGDAEISISSIDEWDKKTKLNFEREFLGLYISDHPLSNMTAALMNNRDMSIAEFSQRAENLDSRTSVTLAGIIVSVDRRISKNGNPWALVTIEDLESSISCLFFGKAYESYSQYLTIDSIVKITGSASLRDGSPSLRAQSVDMLQIEDVNGAPLIVNVGESQITEQHVHSFIDVLKVFPGGCCVQLCVLHPQGNKTNFVLGDNFRVRRDPSLFAEIKTIFGSQCIS